MIGIGTRCPDCGEFGEMLSREETTMGTIRDSTRRHEDGAVCCRDPNRFTEVWHCRAGHAWRVKYGILCVCRGCQRDGVERGNAAQPPPDSSAALRETRRLLGRWSEADHCHGHICDSDPTGPCEVRRLEDETRAFLGERECSSPSSPSDPETPQEEK